MKPTVFQVYYSVIGNKAYNHNKGYYFCIFYIEVVSYFVCGRGIARRCCCGRSAAVVRVRHSEHRVQSSALPPLTTSSQHARGKNSLQIEYISKQLTMFIPTFCSLSILINNFFLTLIPILLKHYEN